jgi:hypothetical protein
MGSYVAPLNVPDGQEYNHLSESWLYPTTVAAIGEQELGGVMRLRSGLGWGGDRQTSRIRFIRYNA